MDWLHDRQDGIEATLARRHLSGEANPSRMALLDVSSSRVQGHHRALAARGYSRDGKKGTGQIEYGLLTYPEGRPVAIRVFPATPPTRPPSPRPSPWCARSHSGRGAYGGAVGGAVASEHRGKADDRGGDEHNG
jgi:hypothetical protein